MHRKYSRLTAVSVCLLTQLILVVGVSQASTQASDPGPDYVERQVAAWLTAPLERPRILREVMDGLAGTPAARRAAVAILVQTAYVRWRFSNEIAKAAIVDGLRHLIRRSQGTGQLRVTATAELKRIAVAARAIEQSQAPLGGSTATAPRQPGPPTTVRPPAASPSLGPLPATQPERVAPSSQVASEPRRWDQGKRKLGGIPEADLQRQAVDRSVTASERRAARLELIARGVRPARFRQFNGRVSLEKLDRQHLLARAVDRSLTPVQRNDARKRLVALGVPDEQIPRLSTRSQVQTPASVKATVQAILEVAVPGAVASPEQLGPAVRSVVDSSKSRHGLSHGVRNLTDHQLREMAVSRQVGSWERSVARKELVSRGIPAGEVPKLHPGPAEATFTKEELIARAASPSETSDRRQDARDKLRSMGVPEEEIPKFKSGKRTPGPVSRRPLVVDLFLGVPDPSYTYGPGGPVSTRPFGTGATTEVSTVLPVEEAQSTFPTLHQPSDSARPRSQSKRSTTVKATALAGLPLLVNGGFKRAQPEIERQVDGFLGQAGGNCTGTDGDLTFTCKAVIASTVVREGVETTLLSLIPGYRTQDELAAGFKSFQSEDPLSTYTCVLHRGGRECRDAVTRDLLTGARFCRDEPDSFTCNAFVLRNRAGDVVGDLASALNPFRWAEGAAELFKTLAGEDLEAKRRHADLAAGLKVQLDEMNYAKFSRRRSIPISPDTSRIGTGTGSEGNTVEEPAYAPEQEILGLADYASSGARP